MLSADLELLKHTLWTREKVQQVATPPAARRLSTLARIDYEDAFLVWTPAAQRRSGEEWARVILNDAPLATRTSLLMGWSSLGLRLQPARSDGYVLGWKVLVSRPDFVLLGAGSPLGFRAQLLCKAERSAILFCTFVHKRNALARTLWKRVEPAHLRVLPRLLGQARIP
jgi:hypothetical protein